MAGACHMLQRRRAFALTLLGDSAIVPRSNASLGIQPYMSASPKRYSVRSRMRSPCVCVEPALLSARTHRVDWQMVRGD